MSAYLYMAKMKILNSLAYRFEVFTSIGANAIFMISAIFIWKSAFHGVDSVAGVNEQQMITYSIISSLLGAIMVFNVQDTINDRVREGQIAIDFMRPLNMLLACLAEDIGMVVSYLATKLIPLLIIASILFKVPLPASPAAALTFVVSCIFSFGILWLLSALLSLIAFWVLELGNMGIVKDAIVRLLSGSIIPIWFFPQDVQKVLNYLPFQYTYQTPLSLYIGRLKPVDAFSSMALQLVWITVLLSLLWLVWKNARKNVLVQGG